MKIVYFTLDGVEFCASNVATEHGKKAEFIEWAKPRLFTNLTGKEQEKKLGYLYDRCVEEHTKANQAETETKK